MASLFNIHIRTGCFCNTGACQVFLGISNQEVKDNLEVCQCESLLSFALFKVSNNDEIGSRNDTTFLCISFECAKAGHVCGDSIDLVDGRPTGSVRVSFGYMSTFEDCQKFLSFIVNCFTDKPFRMDEERLARLKLAVPFVDSVGHFSPSASNGQLEHKTDHRDTAPSLISSTNGREIRIHTPKRPEERNNTQILTNIFIYPIKSCAAFEVYCFVPPMLNCSF